jgi:hypothetical protein
MTSECRRFASRLTFVGTLMLAFPAASPAVEHDETQPSRSVDLAGIEEYQHYLASSLLTPAQVAFVTKERIAVSFLGPCPESRVESTPRLKRRVDDTKTPCTLTLTIPLWNTRSEQVERTLTFPFRTARQSEPSSPPGQGLRLLMPTRNGEFVVHTGAALLRYGSNLELLDTRTIGNPDRTVIFVSPKGTLVLVSEFVAPGMFRKIIFPSDNLPNERLFGVGVPGEGITDAGNVFTFFEKGTLSNSRSSDFHKVKSGLENCHLKSAGAPWCAALCTAEERCSVLGNYRWLVDGTKFATKDGKKFALVDSEDRVLYQGTAKDFIDGFVPGAAITQRLVITGGHTRVSGSAMDWNFVAQVFDLRDMTTALEVNVGSRAVRKIRRPDVALAPDGSQLAILAGSTLRIYQLAAGNH